MKIRPWVESIATHGLIFLLALFVLRGFSLRPVDFERLITPSRQEIALEWERSAAPVEVPKQERSRGSGQPRGHGHSESRSEAPPAENGVPLYQLGVSMGDLSAPKGKITRGDESQPRVGGGADSMVSPEASRRVSLYRYLYDRIDGNLLYPPELRQARITGAVQVRVPVSADGLFQKDLVEVRSDSPYLKVLVLRTLRNALKDGIPAEFLRSTGGKAFALDCQFRFEITEHNDEALVTSAKGIAGNRFWFYRHFHHSVMEWTAGPLAGLGPVPLGVNLLWFYDKAKDIVAPKIKIDPLDSYRNDPDW